MQKGVILKRGKWWPVLVFIAAALAGCAARVPAGRYACGFYHCSIGTDNAQPHSGGHECHEGGGHAEGHDHSAR